MNEIKYDTYDIRSDNIIRNLILLISFYYKLQFIWKFKLSKFFLKKIKKKPISIYNPSLFARKISLLIVL